MKLRTMLLTFSVLVTSLHAAKADDFQFSFTNVFGPTDGTVTGVILGLTNNATTAASQVLILSYPADFGSGGTIDATAFDTQDLNSFTEMNGQVTDGEFLSLDTSTGITLSIDTELGNTLLSQDGHVAAGFGLPVANIVPLVNTAVPEPASLTLLGLAAGVAGVASRRRRA